MAVLFGNRSSFAIEVRPLAPSWDRRYLPERSAWGALLLWVNDMNLCRHSVEGSESFHEALNVPLAPIADWIVRAWPGLLFEERPARFAAAGRLHESLTRWGDTAAPAGLSEDEWFDAREEWWSRHFLAAGADGALLPSLGLVRQDEQLLIEWTPPKLSGGGLSFIAHQGSHELPWNEAEETLASFVQTIAQWLRRDHLDSLYTWVVLTDPLRERRGPIDVTLELYTARSIADLQDLMGAADDRSLLDRLGLPPDASDPAGSPITQVLRDLPPSLPSDAGTVLRQLESAIEHGRIDRLAALRTLSFDARRAATTPQSAGQLAAAALRTELGLDGEPIAGMEEVLDQVGIERAGSDVGGVGRMVTGMRIDRGAAALILRSPRTAVPWGRKFEMARALGHLLLDPTRSGSVGAAASAFSLSSRRRRSGAFAAELLLPESALREASGGKLDQAAHPTVFRQLLDRYGVGARTAAWQLWNRNLLSSADIRDDLIEEYAAAGS